MNMNLVVIRASKHKVYRGKGLWGHSGSQYLRHFVTKCGKSESEEKR